MERLGYDFYHRPCLEVARDLVGKVLVHNGQACGHRLCLSGGSGSALAV